MPRNKPTNSRIQNEANMQCEPPILDQNLTVPFRQYDETFTSFTEGPNQMRSFSQDAMLHTSNLTIKAGEEASDLLLEQVDLNDLEDSDVDDLVPQKKTGRRKIRIEYIADRIKRHVTFSKRKGGLMKKAYELSTLTGTQVLLLVASETGYVYTFATPKFQPIVSQNEGKSMIQHCLNNTHPSGILRTPQSAGVAPRSAPNPGSMQKPSDAMSPKSPTEFFQKVQINFYFICRILSQTLRS